MKTEILKLRQEGKTYTQIQEILGCSKSTIPFHCASDIAKQNHREKSNKWRKENRSRIGRSVKTFNERIHERIRLFCKKDNNGRNNKLPLLFTREEFLKRFGINPICAYTGEVLDLTKFETYELDHIIPVSKGGDNTLQNCQILSKIANRVKSDLTEQELIQFCKTFLSNKCGITE